MKPLKTCSDCGVPLKIGKHLDWNSDGTITQKRDPGHRMLFYESTAMDNLFSIIESIIGVPIGKIVIESKARTARQYVSAQMLRPLGSLARPFLKPLIRRGTAYCRVLGLGDITVTGHDWNSGFVRFEVGEPYSLLLLCGDLQGAVSALLKSNVSIGHERVDRERYVLEGSLATPAPQFEGRLIPRALPRKRGGIRHNICPGCNAPVELSRFRWHPERGTITEPGSGLRMSLFGSDGIQAVFDELERELGETMPRAIVEAQRRHSAPRMSVRWKIAKPADLRQWIAIQGMGNLVSLEQAEGGGFHLCVENPGLPLITVGNAMSFCAFMTGLPCDADWVIEEDGDLVIDLRMRA